MQISAILHHNYQVSLSHELCLAPLPIDRLSKLLSHELCLAPLPIDLLSKLLSHELCLAKMDIQKKKNSYTRWFWGPRRPQGTFSM